MRKKMAYLIIASIIGLLFTNCSQGAMPVVQDVTFIEAVGADAGTMDPHKIGSDISAKYFIYEGLTQYSRLDFKLIPDLAVSWENLDPLTWKFNIRRGVKFHNGQNMTSADVKYSFERMMGKFDPSFPGTYTPTLKELVSEVEAPDEYTVIFRCKRGEVTFPTLIYGAYIVPKAYVETVGDDELSKKPVGTGPYKFVERKVQESITLRLNEEYWNISSLPGQKYLGTVKNVTYKIIPEDSTRIYSLTAGEVNGVTGISADNAKELEKNPDLKVFYSSRNQPQMIVMPWRDKINSKTGQPNPFSDVRVRQAMNYALDINAIIKNYGTSLEQPTTMVGKGAVGYDPKYLSTYKYNPEKARALMKEAGYPNGFSVKWYTVSSTPTYEAMQKYWQDIGVKAEFAMSTAAVTNREMQRKTLDGMVIFVGGMGPDSTTTFFESQAKYDGNYALHEKNDRVEDLALRIKNEFDQNKRAQLIDQVIQIMWQDAWFIPLWEPVVIKALGPGWNYQHEKGLIAGSFFLPAVSKK